MSMEISDDEIKTCCTLSDDAEARVNGSGILNEIHQVKVNDPNTEITMGEEAPLQSQQEVSPSLYKKLG